MPIYNQLSSTALATASTLVQRDSNGNSLANNFNSLSLSITPTGGTTILTSASPRNILVGAGAAQNIQLPNVTTLYNGFEFTVKNLSDVTIKTSDGTTLATQAGTGNIGVYTVVDTTAGGGLASWRGSYSTYTSTASTLMARNSSGNTAVGTITATTFSSVASNPAAAGVVRLGSSDTINFRNTSNSADIVLSANPGSITGLNTNAPLYATAACSKLTSTASSGGTTTLGISSNAINDFTGTLTHTVVMPVASTLVAGHMIRINNYSVGAITVNSSGGNLIATLTTNQSLLVWCKNNAGGTGTASWGWLAPQTLGG